MSALVKAQLLKHLSKFVKNLSADHLTVKLLQGVGDIENIELNEVLLSSTLGLPPWLRLTRAHCNRMSIRLHWTKLTSEPIQIFLDVVYIDLEAAEPTPSGAPKTQQEKEQQASNSAVLNSLKTPYGFINKAIDGLWLVINTVKTQFKAGTFFASLELSHVTLQSCLPDWSRDIKHLKNTRIKNAVLKQVMLFKYVKCNTLRLETSELPPESLEQTPGRSTPRLTPFRVIVNKLVVKIQLKRSLTESSVLFTNIHVEVDDILSVLTDAQAQVGLRFINHLRRLSAGSSVELAAKKAALARTLATGIVDQSTLGASGRSASLDSAVSVTSSQAYHKAHALFIRYDFSEHSTHIKLSRIDLHLVAERAASCGNRELVKTLDPILLEGAVRISLENFCFNVYPAHVLGSGHKGWPRYQRLFRNARTNLETFQGCFEAIGYGSIDAVKLYAANLPHEHNPNQMCIAICGAGKWPAVYFDSSQVVSEKDLTILDSRNAVRVSRINVTFHLPTLLYMIVMAQDARELFKVAEDLDRDSVANRCTKIEIYELDIAYQPQTPKVPPNPPYEARESEPPQPSSRPVVLLSIANVTGQLVQRPAKAITEPTFSQSAEVSETELYAFLHSFLLTEQAQRSLSAEDFEARCSSCCSEIEASRRQLWHWQLTSIFARTITTQDGDIPLLYIPKISGFIPQTKTDNPKVNVMLKCDPVEGPIQVFAERSQFDELQEMLSVFQKLGSNIQKSIKIFENLSELRTDSDESGLFPQQASMQVLFLAPVISMRLLLPAVPPLVVPLTATVATQTGETAPSYLPLQDGVSSSYSEAAAVGQERLSDPSDNSGAAVEDQRPLLPKDSSVLLTSSPDDENMAVSSQDLFGKYSFDEQSPSRSISTNETLSLLEEMPNPSSNPVSSSSSSENISDFVVVKPEDQFQEDDDDAPDPPQPIQNPLDPSSMNFGLQGGAQEVVSVQLLVEGTTVSVESTGDQVIPSIEVRFDRIGPLKKPIVVPRHDVYSPFDVPVSFDDPSIKRPRRQFRVKISDLPNDDDSSAPPRQCIDLWLPPDDLLPMVSMSAINALAHFMSPDAPVTDDQTEPPVINVHTSSSVRCTLKMDTPNVFDHLPQDLIHFVPPPTDEKVMSVCVSSPPLLITRDGFDLSIAPVSCSHQVESLQLELSKLAQENSLLKARIKEMEGRYSTLKNN